MKQDPLGHVRAMARPRAAGSNEEDDARDWCRDRLTENGFSVTEEPFSYSAAVGSWAAPMIAAGAFVVLMIGALAAAQGADLRVAGAGALAFIVGTAIASRWLARTGVLSLPVLRRESVNLVATRGEPRIWLVAHLDSKSQPIPSLVRAAALVAMGAALVLLAVGGLAGVAGLGPRLFMAVILGGALAAAIVSLAGVGNESPGALDNATGLATVLIVAATLPREQPLGIALTSAEELGLAGARAWVRARPPGVAINVDTIDDEGAVRCMTHGRRSLSLAHDLARVAGPGFVIRSLIPGILTDGVALSDAGWQVVTLSRGTARTLARIHRPSDDVRGLTGAGITHVAELLVRYFGRGPVNAAG